MGHLVKLAHVTAAVAIVPATAALFYGSMALVAAIHGNDDQIGCPAFASFDALDGGRTR